MFFLNNEKDILGKFDSKTNKGIFLGYSTSRKAYKVFTKRIMKIEKSLQITFGESNPLSVEVDVVDFMLPMMVKLLIKIKVKRKATI